MLCRLCRLCMYVCMYVCMYIYYGEFNVLTSSLNFIYFFLSLLSSDKSKRGQQLFGRPWPSMGSGATEFLIYTCICGQRSIKLLSRLRLPAISISSPFLVASVWNLWRTDKIEAIFCIIYSFRSTNPLLSASRL